MQKRVSFETLKGLTLSAVSVDDEREVLTFVTEDGRRFLALHEQDCCESVSVEQIDGDLTDLVGAPILLAEAATSKEGDEVNCESATWTFYKLATQKGYVTIRWFGSSNGYYSEEVDFVEET